MRHKKMCEHVLTMHKKLKRTGEFPTVSGNVAMFKDGTTYDIQKDGSWRKRQTDIVR
jgi:hypothetical protein